MAYTTINKSSLHFNTKLYTGNGSVRTETGIGFQPDWTWIKDRTGTNAHVFTDAVRGANYQIYSNLNNAQTNASGYLTAFASDGFTLGTDGAVNQNSSNYASWNWKGAGSTASNSNGSITSTVSANTTAGLSIVKYTGTGSNATVGHGLGVAPSMILFKNLSSARNWIVYHKSVGETKNLYLDLQNAENTSSTTFQDTAPTSTVFSIGTSVGVNESGDDIIAYCFAEKTGYSKFNIYQGNSSADGTFVYTGFKPTFINIKANSRSESWYMFDNKRVGRNPDNEQLYSDANSAEATTDYIDILSNGFKLRQNNVGLNGTGETYVYMAFGQSLVGTNDIPCTAR